MNNKVILDKDLDALFIMDTLINNAKCVLGDNKEILSKNHFKYTQEELTLVNTWFNKCIIDLQNKYGRNDFEHRNESAYCISLEDSVYDTYETNEVIDKCTFIYIKQSYTTLMYKLTNSTDWNVNNFPHLIKVFVTVLKDRNSLFYRNNSHKCDVNKFVINSFFNRIYSYTNTKDCLLKYKGDLRNYIVKRNQDFLYKLKMEEKDNLRYYHTDVLVLEKEDFVSERSKEMLERRFKYSKVIYKDLLHISKCRFDFPN